MPNSGIGSMGNHTSNMRLYLNWLFTVFVQVKRWLQIYRFIWYETYKGIVLVFRKSQISRTSVTSITITGMLAICMHDLADD